jgi:hypothetical protein
MRAAPADAPGARENPAIVFCIAVGFSHLMLTLDLKRTTRASRVEKF